jgi:hypothetical protein
MPEIPGNRIPLRVKTVDGRTVPLEPGNCEPHTPSPRSYLQWGEWADKMRRTHVQRQCRGCGLWEVWEPKEAAEP